MYVIDTAIYISFFRNFTIQSILYIQSIRQYTKYWAIFQQLDTFLCMWAHMLRSFDTKSCGDHTINKNISNGIYSLYYFSPHTHVKSSNLTVKQLVTSVGATG